METGGALKRGDDLLLRYVYNDGTLQAALPLRVVVDTTDVTVGWLTPRTPIMYWATSDGVDPRKVPLDRRFRQRLTTAPRVWEGPGVLRVMPAEKPYQVVHFWTADGEFAGWYINFEAPRRRIGDCIETVDWHLDLWILPDYTATWKDEDEAAAALGTPHLNPDDYELARGTGEALIAGLQDWPSAIGDWRSFRPDPAWTTPDLNHWPPASE